MDRARAGSPKKAVITGTSAGIGRAIAERLLDKGWQITGLDRQGPVIEHANFAGLQFDFLTDKNLEKTLAHVGQVDAIVHAAGFMRTAPIGQLVEEEGEAMWKIHVSAATRLVNLLAPAMGRGGRIVLIGSRTADGAQGRSQYAAAKAALIGLVRSWALELASKGITANVIAPGATETGMLADPRRSSDPPKMPPIGRYIQPREVAAYVEFLLGEDAAAITGQHLLICGGASL